MVFCARDALSKVRWQDERLFIEAPRMQVYYASFQAIEQQTRQLEHEPCRHCRRTQQLISHGMIYKKASFENRVGKAQPEAGGQGRAKPGAANP